MQWDACDVMQIEVIFSKYFNYIQYSLYVYVQHVWWSVKKKNILQSTNAI